MQLEVIRETFPGFYTEEVEVRKENREPFERIYFYDRSEGCENYGSVLTRHKNGSLTVIDTQGFFHVLTESEKLSETKSLLYTTACSTESKARLGYCPKAASVKNDTSLLDILDAGL